MSGDSKIKRLVKAGPAIGATIGGAVALRKSPRNLKRIGTGMLTGAGVGWMPDIYATGARQLRKEASVSVAVVEAFWAELEKIAGPARGIWNAAEARAAAPAEKWLRRYKGALEKVKSTSESTLKITKNAPVQRIGRALGMVKKPVSKPKPRLLSREALRDPGFRRKLGYND